MGKFAALPSTARLDDFQLLSAWQGGDAKAGQALFERHFRSVAAFFRNKCPRDVEDLAQETFLQCVEHKDRYRGESSFRAYLLGIANNVLRMHLRRKGRKEGKIDFGTVSIHDAAPGVSTQVGRRREQQLLAAALRRIPIDHQVLLELYYWEELKAREIAEILAVPEGTVRTRIRKAKALLEAKITEIGRSSQDVTSTVQGLETWARGLRPQADDGET